MAGPASFPHRMPIDRGYAWVVCAASAMLFFVTMGVTKSLGVMLLEFQDHFGSDPGLTSLTVALVAAGFFMFVFFSNTLGLFVGNRIVALCGSTLAAVSMVITAFSPNIYFVVIFLGLLSGIAYSAMFGPPLVILSAYFKDRRALATGLAVAGGSVGQLTIPFLLDFLINFYGFQGGLLLFSGVLLHAIPAALVLRPPGWWTKKQSPETISKTPCCTRLYNVLKVMLDKELLTSSVFYTLLASIILGHMGYFGAVIFFPSAAFSFFNQRLLSIILVSVMGLCDLIGRMMGGYLADLRILAINDLMGISLFVPGVVTVLAGIFPSVWLMFVTAILIGSFAGSYTALLTPVIIEYFGLPKVSPGFGIVTFLMGLFIAPWPTAIAYIAKAAGTYKVVLCINGALMVAGGSVFFLQRCVVQKTKRKQQTEKGRMAAVEIIDAQTDDVTVKIHTHNDVNQNDE